MNPKTPYASSNPSMYTPYQFQPPAPTYQIPGTTEFTTNPQQVQQNQMAVNTANTSQPKLNIPPPPTYSNPGLINTAGLAGNGLTIGSNGFVTVDPANTTPEQQGRANTQNSLMTMLGLNKKENVLSSPEVLQQQAIVQQQRQSLNDYTAQLNSVVAKQNQDLLSTRGTASANGVTEAVYGGIAATINREAAIRALPLQAAVAAAQGNVQLAQEYLTQVTALKTEQVNNEYEYRTNLINAVKDFATTEQKIRLEDKRIEAKNILDVQNRKIEFEHDVSMENLRYQNNRAVAAAGKANTVPTIKSINGTDMQYNPKNGKWEAPSGVGGTTTGQMAQAQGQATVQQITDLTTASGLNSAVGPNPFGRMTFANSFTGNKDNFIAGVEQIRSNLTIEKLIAAKKQGATFGSLTEREGTMLANAATLIGSWAMHDDPNDKEKVTGYKTTESAFKAEFDKIKNFAKLDALLKGADPASIGVEAKPDGTYWTLNSDGTVTQLGN